MGTSFIGTLPVSGSGTHFLHQVAFVFVQFVNAHTVFLPTVEGHPLQRKVKVKKKNLENKNVKKKDEPVFVQGQMIVVFFNINLNTDLF